MAAALAAGNAVLAKPAEQTPITAFLATRLLHEAGVPKDVLHLLTGSGRLGEALVKDVRVRGVSFTGSNETAWIIQRALAERREAIVPFIAETGGINAMIANSSALPEQVVRDCVRSAFDSAGQRCSAARVLFVQEDSAQKTIDMLVGAVETLDIGDPFDYATDIGPVIDEESQDRLEGHKIRMQREARELVDLMLPEHCRAGSYVTPAVYEVDAATALEREVFGPILHVVRYQRGHLDKVISTLNASGFGLTLGLHSRIETWPTTSRATRASATFTSTATRSAPSSGRSRSAAKGCRGRVRRPAGRTRLPPMRWSGCVRPTSRRPVATSSFFPARSPKAKPLRLFRGNIAVGAASRHLGRNQCIRMPPMTPRKPTAAPPVSPSPSRAEKVPVAVEKPAQPPAPATSDAEVAAFIAKMKTLAPSRSADRGRLIFAMDATMSRAPTWDMALALQGDMFSAVKEVGGLDVQLVYFRGMGECRASKWVSDPAALARLMTSVSCHGGLTQIGKVLAHALDECKQRKVNALVYVGDAMEERVDRLCARAGELALLGVPVFLFQEGDDSAAQAPSARSRG